MKDELFSVPEVKSPRLRWIEKHGVEVKPTLDWDPDAEDENGDVVHAWYASDDQWRHKHGGDTENDALAAWAIARGVRLWNEEGLK